MAQALEKLYRSKLAQMPKEEIKIETSSTKTVKKKPPKPPTGTLVGTPPPTTPTSVSSINKIPPKSASASLPQNSITSSNAQVSTMLPSDTTGGISVGSTNKPTTANVQPPQPAIQTQPNHLIMPPQPNNSQMPTSSGASSFLVNQPMINTVSIPSQQPAKVKKGVKRKADTTTPTGFNDSAYPVDAKVSTRGRQVTYLAILYQPEKHERFVASISCS